MTDALTARSSFGKILSLLVACPVYGVTAYLNSPIGARDVMDAIPLRLVKMPHRDGFVPDPLPDMGKAP
jgi:hypothetical protein